MKNVWNLNFLYFKETTFEVHIKNIGSGSGGFMRIRIKIRDPKNLIFQDFKYIYYCLKSGEGFQINLNIKSNYSIILRKKRGEVLNYTILRPFMHKFINS